MREKCIVSLLISIIFIVAIHILFKLFLKFWCKKRRKYNSIDHSYKLDDIYSRIRFTISILMVVVVPVLLLLATQIYVLSNFIIIIKEILIINNKSLIIFITLSSFCFLFILVILFRFIWEIIRKITNIKFNEYDEICEKYNVNNEKRIFVIILKVLTFIMLIFIYVFIIGSLIL